MPTREEYNGTVAWCEMPTKVVEYYNEDDKMVKVMSKERGDSILGRDRMSIEEGM